MVYVNIIASLVLLAGVLFYRFIYPKKKINLFVLLLLISILPIISILRPGDYESGDFNIHIYRIMAFFDSLKEGIIIPSWAGELNATYGNPLFLFNYTLPYYIISFLHFVGFSFITSYKVYLGFTLFSSAIFMYLLAKELTNSKLAALTAAVFYLFAPYHLIDVHFRATLGESTIFYLAPLLFLFLAKYFKNNKVIYLAYSSLLIYLLMLAHPLLAGIFIGVGILFILFNGIYNKNYKSIFLPFIFFLIGIIVSGYIWAPFLIYSPYMYHFPFNGNISFYPFYFLFFSPWRYGFLFQGPKGELQTIIGYTQLFVLLATIILLIYRKFSIKINRQIAFWIGLFLLTLFMMSPLSNIIWVHAPFIGLMLIEYSRLSLVLSFIISIIAGYFALHFIKKEKLIYILLILTIVSTILNWGQRRVIPGVNDTILQKNVPLSTLYEGPSYYADTKWADSANFWFAKVPNKHIEILSGSGSIKELHRTTTKHIYIVLASTNLKIRENTLYFPGWEVISNGYTITSYPGYKGIIEFSLPKGTQNVTVEYNDITSVYLLKLIGIFGVISLFLSILLLFFYNKNKH